MIVKLSDVSVNSKPYHPKETPENLTKTFVWGKGSDKGMIFDLKIMIN